MTDSTPPTLSGTPISFPDVPSESLELGNLVSSFAQAMLGPFEVHDVIGRGGMGIVFSGLHTGQGVPVAIKVITREGAEQPRLRHVMQNEVRAVAALDHPGIVRVLDYGDISSEAEIATEGALRAGSPYFVMELMQHSSLVEICGRVTWRQAKTILLNILDALAHSHARDVIHRDIKPGNILLDAWGGRVIPRLADFGLAFATRTVTDASRSIGTPQYMAPEQIETPWRKHGPWSDLYSLGCLAFELISGRKLFHGRSILEIFRHHLDGPRRPLRSIVKVPEGFEAWLDKMLERNAQDRFQTAAAAYQALAALDDADIPNIQPPDCTQHEFAPLTPCLGALQTHHSSFSWPKRHPVSMRLVGAGQELFGLRQSPLVGRRTELSVLWGAFEAVRDAGGPRVVILRGAHGSGKTKLADDFVARLCELGVVSPLRASHHRDQTAGEAVAAMAARQLRAAGATRAEAGGIVREALAEGAQRFEWEAILTLIEPHLAGAVGRSKYAFEFGSSAQRHEVVIRQLRRAASKRPIAVVLDDAHFGEDSLEMLAQVLGTTRELPALFVVTVADEELVDRPQAAALLEKLAERDEVRMLDVGPLGQVEHLELVQEMLLLGGELATHVVDRTEGNPGFATQLIGEWVQMGQLVVGETGFVLADGLDLTKATPQGLQELWRGTLERLLGDRPDYERQSLELAAALGTPVDHDEWTAICRDEGLRPCWAAVNELVDHRLASMSTSTWQFEHPVANECLRDAAMAAGRWKRWSEACARYLSDTPELSRRSVERLGEYYLEAEQWEAALEPLDRSTKIQLVQGNYRDADRLASGLLHALGELPDAEVDIARAYLLRSRIYIGMGRADEALRWARKALELVGEADGHNDIKMTATGFVALAKQWLGETDADDWLNEALGLVPSVGRDSETHGVLMVLGYQLTSLGRFGDAVAVLSKDYEMAKLAGDARALASCAYQRSRTAIYMREFELARKFGEEARDLYERIGHVPALAAALAMLAEMHRFSGDLEDAQRLYRESIELSQSVGQKTFVSEASLGVVLISQRRFQEAEELFITAAKESAILGRKRTEIVCHAGMLVCAVEQQHLESARRLLKGVHEFCDATTETEIDLAELLEHAGDGFNSRGALDDARAAWELARRQWGTLDAADRAAVVDEKLASL